MTPTPPSQPPEAAAEGPDEPSQEEPEATPGPDSPAAETSALNLEPADTPTPEPTATPVPTDTPVPTATPTFTPEPTQTPLPTATFTPSPSPTVPPPTATATATPQPTATRPPTGGTAQMGPMATELLRLHNIARSASGLQELTPDGTLVSLAQTRANIMAEHNLFSHYGPDGKDVFDLMAEVGFDHRGGAAENIHYNWGYSETQSVQVAHESFMNSPRHRDNILTPSFRRVGIGIAVGADGSRYFAVVFAN